MYKYSKQVLYTQFSSPKHYVPEYLAIVEQQTTQSLTTVTLN